MTSIMKKAEKGRKSYSINAAILNFKALLTKSNVEECIEGTARLRVENRSLEADPDDAALEDGAAEDEHQLAKEVVGELVGAVDAQKGVAILDGHHTVDGHPDGVSEEEDEARDDEIIGADDPPAIRYD